MVDIGEDEMCLNYFNKDLPDRDYGWKCFIKVDKNNMRSPIYDKDLLPVGEWIKNKKSPWVRSTFGDSYRAGFHVFKSREGARVWCDSESTVRKVMIKNVTSKGVQGFYDVYVCQEMLITDTRG